MELQRFKDFQPTNMDSENNYMDFGNTERIIDWFVGPIKTKGATLLDICNFDCILKDLGGEGDNVEIASFGHWAIGSYELILIRPDTKQANLLENIAEALEDYPVYDESAYSEAELGATLENIAQEIPNDLTTTKNKYVIAAEVWDWFKANDPNELENKDDQGGFPDEDLIEKALKELGYYSKEEIDREHQEDLMTEVYPDDFLCCDNHHERKHSEDS